VQRVQAVSKVEQTLPDIGRPFTIGGDGFFIVGKFRING
jgi:hypothetical protein